MSTNPGATNAPPASTSRSPFPPTRPTSTTLPSRTATSAVVSGTPVPSMTVPPRMTRSNSAMSNHSFVDRQFREIDVVKLGHVLAQDGPLLLVGEIDGVLVEQLLRPRPGRVTVRKVVGPHQTPPVHVVGEAERGPV